uniref:Prephenate dehydrogenase n=1 Tax=Chlorobium chlorochromatii (strain CaD3) TaxID=340177 RepID=Q3ANS6_CHLCH
MEPSSVSTIAIVGLGLIGMSLVRAFHHSPFMQEQQVRLIGYDPHFSESDCQCALELGLHSFESNPETLYRAEIVILAAPVEVNIALLESVRNCVASHTLVTDVSSTKRDIALRAKQLQLPFVGMHPMAGKEEKGYQASHEELLHGKRMIFCDDDNLLATPQGEFLQQAIASIGCTTLFMTSEEHDAVVARVSHLPQLLSTLLMEHCGDAMQASGPGFATLTRLSGSSWEIWHDIVATNQMNIATELTRFSSKLLELSQEIQMGNFEQVAERFNHANQLYQALKAMNQP